MPEAYFGDALPRYPCGLPGLALPGNHDDLLAVVSDHPPGDALHCSGRLAAQGMGRLFPETGDAHQRDRRHGHDDGDGRRDCPHYHPDIH
jgi:hypothetical protein